MAAILDAILDFEECQQGISGDFLSVILQIFLDLSWKNQLVTKNGKVKTNIIGLQVQSQLQLLNAIAMMIILKVRSKALQVNDIMIKHLPYLCNLTMVLTL